MQAEPKNRWRFDPENLTAREALLIAFVFFLTVGVFLAADHDRYVKFGGLTISTAILFGYYVHDSREYLRKRRFWMLTACLLALHLVAWITLLIHVEKWGLLWFNIMVFELPVFWYLRDRPGLLN
jgi:hypothetical protein